MLVAGRTYTAVAQGQVWKTVECVRCGYKFVYRMRRACRGEGKSLYFLNNAGAEERAERSAQARLARALEHGCDPVPCQKCGVYQPEMVVEWRRRKYLWQNYFLIVPALQVLADLGLTFFNVPFTMQHFMEELTAFPWFYISLASLVAYGVTWIFRQQKDPNRGHELRVGNIPVTDDGPMSVEQHTKFEEKMAALRLRSFR